MPGHADPDSLLPALPAAPPRAPLVPERADFLEDGAPAADKVEAFRIENNFRTCSRHSASTKAHPRIGVPEHPTEEKTRG